MRRFFFLLALLLAGCDKRPELTVHEVQARPFVHKVTAEGTLKAKETTKITVPPTVRRRVRLEWLAPSGTELAEGDLVARFDAEEFERSLDDAQTDLAATNRRREETRAEGDVKLGEHQRDYEIAELELGFAERFELTDDFVFSRHEIARDAIDEQLAVARRNHAAGMTGIQRDLLRTELQILEIEERRSDIKIEEAAAGLASLEVRAPHRGVLSLARNWRGETLTIGAEMWRGQEIGEIPALNTVEAEVFVLEADAGGVGQGQRASVIVESITDRVLGGQVSRVEAIAKPRFRGTPVQYFGVTLEFPETDPDTMKPGQRVVATLYIEEREKAIVVPRQAVFQDRDRFWVYKKVGRSFTPAQVDVGAGSAALMVIEEGLSEGEAIALVRPPDIEDLLPLDTTEAGERQEDVVIAVEDGE